MEKKNFRIIKSRTTNFDANFNPHFDTIIGNYVKKLKKSISNKNKNNISDNENNLPHKNQNILLSIPFHINQSTMNILTYIFSKKLRNKNDLLYIQHFLTNYKSLMNTLYQNSFLSDPNELLNQLSMYILMEKFKKDQVICHFGDIGDKFYFVISGNLSVLIPKELKVVMTKHEYNAYLNKLFLNNQFYLLIKTIDSNLKIFNSFYVHQIRNSAEEEIKGKESTELCPILSKKSSKPIYVNNYEFISVDEYISQTLPGSETEANEFAYDDSSDDNYSSKEPLSPKKRKYQTIIWTFHQVTTLSSGATFGDVALSQWNTKRTATIITTTNCSLGYLNIKNYKKCIKKSQDTIRKKDVSSIQSIPLFKSITMDYFNQKYFNYFKINEYNLGENLFSQGDERKELFFLKEGEIEINLNISLREINKIIKMFDPTDNIQEEKYWKIIDKKMFFKVLILKTNDAIGFDDIMYNKKFFVNAKCISLKTAIFTIEEQLFNDLILDPKIKESYEQYNLIKKNLMLKRLVHIRSTIIQSTKVVSIPKDMNYTVKVSSIRSHFTKNLLTSRNLFSSTVRKKIDGSIDGPVFAKSREDLSSATYFRTSITSNKRNSKQKKYNTVYSPKKLVNIPLTNKAIRTKMKRIQTLMLSQTYSSEKNSRSITTEINSSINPFRYSRKGDKKELTKKTDEIDAFVKRIQKLSNNELHQNKIRNIMNSVTYLKISKNKSVNLNKYSDIGNNLDFLAVDNYLEKNYVANSKKRKNNYNLGNLKGKKIMLQRALLTRDKLKNVKK